MLVSWEWLQEYVDINCTADDLANRFALSGLNHESTEQITFEKFAGNDTVIDLEVTSNRGDCLGHIGIAREASVLLNTSLRKPEVEWNSSKNSSKPASDFIKIKNAFPEGCSRYIGRVIKGVKIAPSPEWLQKRLLAINVKPINNVVDVTNYVMFECGQPLHAFDLKLIQGAEILIRPAAAKEKFVAIDHRTYELDPTMIVIADANNPVALGGVMGGAESEVSNSTTDLLIEAADFTPLAIRRTARKLRLHSPSSYRFERRVDPSGLDWASRRCCQLILELAGGLIAEGSVDTGEPSVTIDSVQLRHSNVSKVLGIDIEWNRCLEIISKLGCEVDRRTESEATIVPPRFRHDLTREIDLIEEIARIHGYDAIPENAAVPIFVSSKRNQDVMLERVRSVAVSTGFDEALTPSVVNQAASQFLSPWTDKPALQTKVQLLEGATFLRRSLVPSLLQSYLMNQSQQNRDASLFETAMVYLPAEKDKLLPTEQWNFGWVGPRDIRVCVGMVEEIVQRVSGSQKSIEFQDFANPAILNNTGSWISIDGAIVGWSGLLSSSSRNNWKIDASLAVGELNLHELQKHLCVIPRLTPLATFPAIERDLNLIVDETLRWSAMSSVVKTAAGKLMTDCVYKETYRDAKKDGEGKKRVLFTLVLQSPTQTLTGEQADAVVNDVLEATKTSFNAKLLA